MSAPLGIPMSRLESLLNEAVPRTFGSLDERRSLPDRDRTEIAFALERGDLQARMDGSLARVEGVIEYALRAYYDPPVLPEVGGSCGTGDDPKRRLRVVIEAPMALTDQWRLATRSRVVTVEPPTDEDRDRCQVTFLGIDLTDRVVEGARAFLEEQERTVDSIAAAVDLRPSFDDWWTTLQTPVELTDSVWLVLAPESVRRGALRGSADSLWVDLALQARPRVVVGPRPPPGEASLPGLEAGEVVPGLELLVEGRVDYGTASRLILHEIAGTRVEHEGRVVTVDSLRVFGIGGGQVAVDVVVSGDLSARLFFTGTPALDPATQLISVPDLDFDVATENVVLAAASWIRQQGLRQLLRERATWPAAPATEWLTTWLDRGLNREISDDLRVEGRVLGVSPQEVHALRDRMIVRIAARAEA
ncbi:MAG TPA: DUF4403 family protein, partial [Longimicrobiales bacterium]|nr:DUF4403 family protein [Longimicrobiales bacterium]